MNELDILVMRRLLAEAYNAFLEEFEAWQSWNEDDPEFFECAPDFFDFVARYLLKEFREVLGYEGALSLSSGD